MKTALIFALLSFYFPAECGEIKIGISYSNPPAKAEISCEAKCLSGKTKFSRVVISARGQELIAEYPDKTEKLKRILIESDGKLRISYFKKSRTYYGKIYMEPYKNSLKIINICDLEKYLESVVSAEVRDLKNYEAYKAQAVIARTYTLVNIDRHKKSGFHICDNTHCQLYNGYENISPKAAQAVKETEGEILEYRGRPAWTFYHSICGGVTDSAWEIWPYEKKPYLRSVKDGPPVRPYCRNAPGFLWRTKIKFSKFEKFSQEKIFKAKLPLTGLSVSARTQAGRAKTLKFVSGKYEKTVSVIDFYHIAGRYFGWEAIRSAMFDVSFEKFYVVFKGKGHGHGVGLCQHGADAMAELGYDYNQILEHYYKDLKLVRRKL